MNDEPRSHFDIKIFIDVDALTELGLVCPVCNHVPRNAVFCPGTAAQSQSSGKEEKEDNKSVSVSEPPLQSTEAAAVPDEPALHLESRLTLTACGQAYCSECLGQATQCPVCHGNPSATGATAAASGHGDAAVIRRLIDRQLVRCVNDECRTWTGPRGDLAQHVQHRCPHSRFTCADCNLSQMTAIQLEQHRRSQCTKRSFVCSQCQSSMPFDQLERHTTDVCPMALVHCPRGCSKQSLLRSQLAQHMTDDCPFTLLPCPLQAAFDKILQVSSADTSASTTTTAAASTEVKKPRSCPGVPRSEKHDLGSHLADSACLESHLYSMWSCQMKQADQITALQTDNASLRQQLHDADAAFGQLKKRFDSMTAVTIANSVVVQKPTATATAAPLKQLQQQPLTQPPPPPLPSSNIKPHQHTGYYRVDVSSLVLANSSYHYVGSSSNNGSSNSNNDGKPHVGDYLDVHDREGCWCLARVRAIGVDKNTQHVPAAAPFTSQTHDLVMKIHYVGWPDNMDEWIRLPVDPNRVALAGSRSQHREWKNYFCNPPERKMLQHSEYAPFVDGWMGRLPQKTLGWTCCGSLDRDKSNANTNVNAGVEV